MIDVDALYFKWLLKHIDDSIIFERFCWMLHRNVFTRRVGNDVNRAVDGINLRVRFLDDLSEANIDPRLSNELMSQECSWFEMLVALANALDYLYEGGTRDWFVELINNMGLIQALNTPDISLVNDYNEVDQRAVDNATVTVDKSLFTAHGRGGLFPLQTNNHPDQREVEIWEQHAAYVSERLEGVMWTSTN